MLAKAAQDPALSGLPLRVAVMLAVKYLNSRSETAWPSGQRLADDLKVARRSIWRALDQLVAAGLIVRQRGDRRSNVYALADSIDRLRRQEPDRARKAKRRDPGTPFPTGWVIGNEELKIAHQVAGWDYDKTAEQFEAFEAWALGKGILSSNWGKTWQTFCIRGRERQEHQAKQRKRNGGGMDAVIEGLNRWGAEREARLAEQERKKEQERKNTRH